MVMRYVVVRDRYPWRFVPCALCTERVKEGYVHELSTNLYYCTTNHYHGAVKVAIAAIEHRARRQP